jgi:hypothetical protein
MKSKVKNYPLEKISIAFVFAAGILLSLLQFLYNRSLYMDEASLALNIIHKSSLELLQPLDYNQVAPILFLQIEKLFSTLLPNTEYGLRIFPLLCFWASMYFFYKIIRIRLHNIYAVILALSLFVFNATLLYYSSEAKQYMSDVLVLLFLFHTLLKGYKKEKNRLYVLGIAGVIAIFLSNIAPIILFTCGIYLLYNDFFITRKKRILSLSLVFAAWLIAFAVCYYFFIYEHPNREFMVGYWNSLEPSFLPHNSVSGFYYFLYNNFVKIHLLFRPAALVIIFSIVGIISIVWKQKIRMAILVFTPVLLHLFLSTLQLYPFEIRLILYIFPCVILVCSAGFEHLIEIVFADLKIKKFRLFALIIPMLLLYPFSEFPIQSQILRVEIKKSLKYIEKNIREGESVFVHMFYKHNYRYYNDIGFIHIEAPFIVGVRSDEENVKKFKNLHGKNWVLTDSFVEESIINQLDSLGYNKIEEFHYHKSSAYLYDFGPSPEDGLE